jgi:CRISPR-associated endonuclease Csn1
LGAPYKSRDSHRHHAIDAIVTACAHPGLVREISKFFKTDSRGRLDFAAFEKPWPGFYENARQHVLSLFISHVVSAPVNGQIHEETNYGRLRSRMVNGNKKEVTYYRKPIIGLTKGEVSRIVDNRIRMAVEDKINEVGSAKKISKDDLPRLANQGPVIKKVRMWKAISLQSVGKQSRKRQVKLGENHHIEIFEVLDNKGKVKKWSGKVVSLYEAMQRKRQGLSIVNRDQGPKTRFLFSFVKNDCFRAIIDEKEVIFLIRSFWTEKNGNTRLRIVNYNDARKNIPSKEKPQPAVNRLRNMQCQKVTISPIGEVYQSNA